MMNFFTIDTGPCDQQIEVAELGIVLRYWIIVGGTPALSYEGYEFSRRFETRPDGNGYDPDWENEIGPEAIEAWLKDTWQDYVIRKERLGILADKFGPEIKSKRLHDKSERCYGWAEVRLDHAHISKQVRVSGARGSWGIHSYDDVPEPWMNLDKVLYEIFADTNLDKPIEKLSEEEFTRLVQALEGAEAAGN